MKYLLTYLVGLMFLILPFSFFFDIHPLVLSESLGKKEMNIETLNNGFIAKIVGERDNLGIIGFQFQPEDFTRDNGMISFRMTESGSDDVIKDIIIKNDQIVDNLYQFGFPLIKDSKNKKYLIVVEGKNYLKKKAQPKSITVRYKMTKAYLLNEPTVLPTFLKDKIIFALKESRFVNLILLYTIFMAFMYVYAKYKSDLKIWEFDNVLKVLKKYIIPVSLTVISLFLRNGLFTMFTLFIFVIASFKDRFNNSVYFFIISGLLGLSFIMTIIGYDKYAEILAIGYYQLLIYILIKEVVISFKTKHV